MLLNRNKISFLSFTYAVLLSSAAVLTFLSNGADSNFTPYLLGQMLGSVALTSLVVHVLFSVRMPILEKGVGQDRLLLWHRYNAVLFTTLILFHPLLFLIDLGYEAYSNFFSLFAFWLGVGAFALIIFTMVTSIFSKKLHINYELWKLLHFSGYFIIILALVHSILIGSHLSSPSPLFYWWILLLFLVLAALIWRFIVRPLRLRHQWYRVDDVVKESSSVVSVYLEPLEDAELEYTAGQFAYVIFESNTVKKEEHHFTLSSAPNSNRLRFTIKNLGDFTGTLENLSPGDTARIEGPFGTFSNEGMEGPFVFMAAGIGITPVMSILEQMEHTDTEIETVLLYANKKREEAVFLSRLKELEKKHDWFTLNTAYSQEKVAGSFYGRIDEEIIKQTIELEKPYSYFLVGPKSFLASIKAALRVRGVANERIFTERFELKDWGEE